MLRVIGLAAWLIAGPATAFAADCDVSITGPQIAKVDACKGERHVWSLANACTKNAVVRYLSMDAHRWGEIFVKAKSTSELECCVTGNYTCQFESWTTEFR